MIVLDSCYLRGPDAMPVSFVPDQSAGKLGLADVAARGTDHHHPLAGNHWYFLPERAGSVKRDVVAQDR